MEELIECLQANAQTVDEVQMVPLTVAMQLLQIAGAYSIVDSLEEVSAQAASKVPQLD